MAQSLVDKVKGILYRNGMGGSTLTGQKVEPVIINPPDKQKREGFENAKASNLVEKLLRKGRGSKGCSRCGDTCGCTKEERAQAEGSELSEQKPTPLNLRIATAEHGHSRLSPEQKATRRRAQGGTTEGKAPVSTSGAAPKTKSSSPTNFDSVYEQRYVIPAQRSGEEKAKVVVGLDKNLEPKDVKKQLPRRRGDKLFKQVVEMLGAGDSPMSAGKRIRGKIPEGMERGTDVGSAEVDDRAMVYSTPTSGFKPDAKPKKKKTISASYEYEDEQIDEVSLGLAKDVRDKRKNQMDYFQKKANWQQDQGQDPRPSTAKSQTAGRKAFRNQEHVARKEAQQSNIPEEAGENDQPKGRLYLHLDVARRYALQFGGIVARDEGTGKYFVKAKGKYKIEQDETLGKKVLTILESIRFRTAHPVQFVKGKRKPLKYAKKPTKPRTTRSVAMKTEEVGFGSSPVPAFMKKK